ncbi:MAG: PASTA domain-containing protein, partial [Chloroflexota bacterium]
MDETLIGGRYRPVERTGTDDRVARWIAFDEQTGELLAVIVSLRPLNAGSREEIWFRGLAPRIGGRYDSAAGVIVDHLTEDEIDGRAAAAPPADRGPAPILRPATPVGRAIVRPVPIRQAVPFAARPTAARPVAWPPAPPAETRTAPAARSDVAAAQQAVRAEIEARRTTEPAAAPVTSSPERLRDREAAIAPDRRTGATRSATARPPRRSRTRGSRTLLLPAGALAGGLAVVLGASVLLLAPPTPADPSASGIAQSTTFVVRPSTPAELADRAGDPVAGGRPVAQVGGFPVGTSAPGDPAVTPAPRRVAPAAVGLPVAQAVALAEQAGLAVAISDRRLIGARAGTVVGQDPAAGTRMAAGATFRLVVAVAAAEAPAEPDAPPAPTTTPQPDAAHELVPVRHPPPPPP